MTVTVEYLSANPVKIVSKKFKTRADAIYFLIHVKGDNIVGYLDDGTFSVYRGKNVS
jgi:hypothetical protein